MQYAKGIKFFTFRSDPCPEVDKAILTELQPQKVYLSHYLLPFTKLVTSLSSTGKVTPFYFWCLNY